MTIFCIGYFDKHSRFFLGIKKALKTQNSHVNFKIANLCFSGFLYQFIRLKHACWLPVKAWWKCLLNKKKYAHIVRSKTTYKEIPFSKLITFHKQLNASISEKQLLYQALAYIDIFDNDLKKNKVDLILLIGDSRLSIEVCIAVAQKQNIKIYYIEQGPFNTTFFNDCGVNANAIVSTKKTLNEISIINKKVDCFINTAKNKTYARSFVYRALDMLLANIFQTSILYPPDLKYADTFPKIKKKKHKTLLVNHSNKTVILLILQVPMDVNMIYHSPYFKNHYAFLKEVHQNLPHDCQLIIREHPVYKGSYEKKLYQYAKHHQLAFNNNMPLKQAITQADLVVVNNSTVGIETIALKKKVVVLGNAFYKHPEICFPYEGSKNLKQLFNTALKTSLNTENISHFIYNLTTTHLISGSISDKKLSAANRIANKITSS